MRSKNIDMFNLLVNLLQFDKAFLYAIFNNALAEGASINILNWVVGVAANKETPIRFLARDNPSDEKKVDLVVQGMDEIMWLEKHIDRVLDLADHGKVTVSVRKIPNDHEDLVELLRAAKVVPINRWILAIVYIKMRMNDLAIAAILSLEAEMRKTPQPSYYGLAGLDRIDDVWKIANGCGNPDVIKWLEQFHSSNRPNKCKLSLQIGRSGDIEACKLIHSMGHFSVTSFLSGAVSCGRLGAVKWALDKYPDEIHHAMESAMEANRLGMCKWINHHFGMPATVSYKLLNSCAMVRWSIQASPPTEMKRLIRQLDHYLVSDILEECFVQCGRTDFDPILALGRCRRTKIYQTH
jgi:hypothetical protein